MFNRAPKNGNVRSAQDHHCPSYNADFLLTAENRLRIYFLKRHLPKELIQQQFGSGRFEMPFSYELPSHVLLKLGIESYKIPSGSYAVQEDSDFIRIDF